MPHLIIHFLLFVLAFLIWPYGSSQFEIPKVIVGMAMILALGITIFRNDLVSILKIDKNFLLIVGALILLTIVHVVFVSTPLLLLGNQFRMQGILLLWSLIGLSFFSSQIPYRKISYYWYVLLLILTLVGSLIFGNSVNRSVGTLGEPNALAAYTVFLWPFIVFAKDIPKKYRLFIRGVSLLMVVLIILFSGSRSGLIAFVLQTAFYGIFVLSNRLKLAVIISFILLGSFHVLPIFEQVKYESRSAIWQTAVTAGMMNPIIGGGFGNTELWLREVIVQEHNSLIGYYVDSSHNMVLDWWVQGGLVGVGILLILIILAVRNFYTKKHTFFLILLLGVFTTVSFNPASVITLIHLWWLLGQGFVRTK